MDYKYIKQLLQRYWDCETSVEEEHILQSFFQQKDIPADLLKYRPLFVYQKSQKTVGLNEEFDQKILKIIEKPVVKAKRISFVDRLSPLFKAAAVIAVLFSVGVFMQKTMDRNNNGVIYVYDQYKGHKSDPQVAYESNVPVDSIANVIKRCDSTLIKN